VALDRRTLLPIIHQPLAAVTLALSIS